MKNKQLIKRCPFCGGKAKVMSFFDEVFFIQCTGCGIRTQAGARYKTALNVWNKRTTGNENNRRNQSGGIKAACR